jgi:hypothetical protein
MGGLMSSQLLQQVGAAVCNTNGDGSTPKCCNIIIPTLDPVVTTEVTETTCDTGTIPGAIGRLEKLEVFRLPRQTYPAGFSGTLPIEIFSLVNLRSIDIGSSNPASSSSSGLVQISGSLPAALGQLIKLTTLSIRYVNLQGTVPKDIGLLKNLNMLMLSGVSGSLPNEIGALTKLVDLVMSATKLSGTLPPGLYHLVNLKTFRMQGTEQKISGTLSGGIGKLKDLEVFGDDGISAGGDPPFGSLSGTLPIEFFSLVKLRAIYIGAPTSPLGATLKISGTLSGALGQLIELTYLAIRTSLLLGTIPKEIGLLTNLGLLDFAGSNLVSGSLPNEIAALVKLTTLAINGRNDDAQPAALSGTLPINFGHLVSLNKFFMLLTKMSGTVPTFEPGFNRFVNFQPPPGGPGDFSFSLRFTKSCQPGSVSNVHRLSRTGSSQNFYRFLCAKCDYGKFIQKGECVPCVGNTYSDVIGFTGTTCKVCGTLADRDNER